MTKNNNASLESEIDAFKKQISKRKIRNKIGEVSAVYVDKIEIEFDESLNINKFTYLENGIFYNVQGVNQYIYIDNSLNIKTLYIIQSIKKIENKPYRNDILEKNKNIKNKERIVITANPIYEIRYEVNGKITHTISGINTYPKIKSDVYLLDKINLEKFILNDNDNNDLEIGRVIINNENIKYKIDGENFFFKS